MRIRVSNQPKTVLVSGDQDIEQHGSQLSYQKLKPMVQRCVDQRIRARNFDARTERMEIGEPATGKGESVSVAWKQGAIKGILETVQRLHQWEMHEHLVCMASSRMSSAKLNREVRIMWNQFLCKERWTVVSRRKNRKKTTSERSVTIPKKFRQLICAFQDRAAEIQFDCKEEHQIFGTESQRASLKRSFTPRENSGKKGSVARCGSEHWFSWARSPYVP